MYVKVLNYLVYMGFSDISTMYCGGGSGNYMLLWWKCEQKKAVRKQEKIPRERNKRNGSAKTYKDYVSKEMSTDFFTKNARSQHLQSG